MSGQLIFRAKSHCGTPGAGEYCAHLLPEPTVFLNLFWPYMDGNVSFTVAFKRTAKTAEN